MGEIQSNPRPTISVERATEADIREAMMGPQGNPTYEQQFGQTTAPLGSVGVTQPSLAELEIQAQQALARAINPNAYIQQNPNEQPFSVPSDNEVEKWKRLYGQSENEKGEARRREQELTEAFNGLMGQFEQLQANTQQRSWSPQMPPQNFGPQVPYGQTQNPFDKISDDEFMQGRQVKDLIEQHIAPPLAAAFQQSQESAQRIAQLERALLNQARATSGISKLDEFRLAAKNPWLNNLPEGQRLAAISSLKQAEVPLPQVQSPQVQAETQNRIMNKITYIEGSNPNVPDATEAAVEAAKQRDYALAMAMPAETGERARALRAVATKYNMNIGQNPSDLAR